MGCKPKLAMALVAAGLVGATTAVRADMYLYAKPTYSTGSYGTGTTTQIEGIIYGGTLSSVANDFKDETSNKIAFDAWVPFLSVQGRGVITSDGRVIGRSGTTGPTTTTIGWGDWQTQISDTYSGASFGSIFAYAGLKLVTGTRALGTGKNDYDFGATYSTRPITIDKTAYTPFVGISYTVMGKPPGLSLQNYAGYFAGFNTYAMGGFVSGSLSYTGSAQTGFPAATAANVSWGHNLLKGRSAFNVGLSKGLSNGSPNWSAWISIGIYV
ncbi:MAG: hypothetical protein ACYDEV_13750 [Acidiferrobacter sp.]